MSNIPVATQINGPRTNPEETDVQTQQPTPPSQQPAPPPPNQQSGEVGSNSGVLASSQSNKNYVTEDSMASNQAAKIMAEDSPLMQQAETKAKQYTNQHGLSNSTMGTSAALDSVTSVASELGINQASMYGANQQANQQADIDSGLLEQKIQGESDLSAQNADQDIALANREHVLAKNYQKTAELLKQKTLAKQQAFEAQQTQAGYDQANISNMTSMINSQTQVLTNQIGNLLNNTDIEMDDGVIEWMTEFQNASWESAAALMGLDIEVA